MSDRKRQKCYEVQSTGDTVDEISNLPDCILHHILSFLPTKDVVKTCILSTRWKNLWTSVPNMDFDDELLYASELNGGGPLEVTCFMSFIERVFKLRDVSTMRKFRLSCRVCFNASRIHAWVAAAMMHNIQELDLCLFVEDPFALPCCVFNSKSLTAVKIEMNSVLELPTCICFPCLKTLHLSLVTFPNEDSTQNLFSSCPVLQELAILDCEWMNLKSITIANPTLKSLTIDDLPYFGPPDDPRGCEITIAAENLVYLNYIGYLSNEIVLHNVSSLVKAFIDIPFPCERQKEITYRAVELLRGLHRISSLRISERTIESLISADNVLDHLPLFQNLTHLELTMEIENHTVRALLEFLHCCPNLQSLYFAEGPDCHTHRGDGDLILTSVPKCLLSCLKTITFKNFCGMHMEMCFVRYLLTNALVLERMSIYRPKNALGHLKKQGEVKNQLQMLANSSMACVITFL